MPRKKKRSTNGDLAVLFILDGSGSMSPVQDDVVKGVNAFIDKQKEEVGDAETRFWLTVFDTNIYPVYRGEDIANVNHVTQQDTLRGGMTALLDAVGKTVSQADGELRDFTGKKLCVIYTDGQENSSREFDKGKVNGLIKNRENQGDWTFFFMGADQDAWANAGALGFAQGNVISTSTQSVPDSLTNLAVGSKFYRYASGGGTQSMSSYIPDWDTADADYLAQLDKQADELKRKLWTPDDTISGS